MSQFSYAYTDEMINFILQQLKKKKTWDDIAEVFNSKFNPISPKTGNAIRKAYYRHIDLYKYDDSQDSLVRAIKDRHNAKSRASRLIKENKEIISEVLTQEALLSKISDIFSKETIKVSVKKAPAKSKKKKDLAIEVLISDIHVGMETKSYDTSVCSKRIKKLSDTVLSEIKRKLPQYNVTKIQLLLNGDIMQGNNLHADSHASCETTDAQQVADSIRILFYDLVAPLAKTGIKVDVIGTCGNHDRPTKDRYTVRPGETYLTYIIYKSLEMLCKEAKLKNVSMTIPVDEFAAYEMFGHWFLVEHGHAPGCKNTPQALEKQLLRRGNQLGKILKGIRIGHYHEVLISGLGRHIVNGSTVTDDHFGSSLGYVTQPCQVVSFYVNTESRDTSYYYSFPVNLEDH